MTISKNDKFFQEDFEIISISRHQLALATFYSNNTCQPRFIDMAQLSPSSIMISNFVQK